MAADFISLIGIGATSFAATNIDDLFILMAFFANHRSFPISQVVLGQYVGMGALLAIGIVGSLIALVVPNNLIGFIGIFPIAIGIKELLELRKNDDDEEEEEPATKQPSQRSKWIVAYLPFLTVAAVTFSGGEEVGIYTSVFAINNEPLEIITIISVVMGLTGVWCGVASYLVNHSFLADRFRRITSRISPFVLIGLGLYIMAEAFLL
ncbi:MAG TPA: cadmium resistance transporter [Nitrososphaeraceae archaeon]|nr:cadmium resistance transporter [Nitrososphaeraceae archaeon]